MVTLPKRTVNKVRLVSLRKSSTRAALRLPPAASTSNRNLLTLKIASLVANHASKTSIVRGARCAVDRDRGRGL